MLLCAFGTTSAQNWSLTPTMPQGTASDLQYWDDQLLLTTYGGFIFKSTNEGQSWQPLPLPGNPRPIFGLLRSRDHWFASCVGGFYTSTNGGNSWHWVSIPSAYVPSGFAVLASGHWVVTTTDLVQGGSEASGIMRSTNNGQSWHSVSANLPGTSIFKLLHKDDDQLTLALNQPNKTAALFTTWIGPLGTFLWFEMPIRLFHQSDSSRADFKATEWFDLQWYDDTTLLISAEGIVQEPGAPNGVFVQWMGKRRNNPFEPHTKDPWVETMSFGPQYSQWWDQPAPANILRLKEKPHIYGSLEGGNARGGAWVLSDTSAGWQKRNSRIAPGPNGWEVLKFAEGPLGRVFAIHQGYAGVYYNDFSRRWATSASYLRSEPLRLWPNPGNGLVQVEWPAASKNIQVLNNMGQVVWEASPNNQAPTTLDVQFLPTGMYFLQTEHQGTIFQVKYLKTN